MGVHVRRLQALHERRLPRRLPDRRAHPHRVRDRGRCRPTSATAAATASPRARSGSSTATPTTAAPPSAPSVTTASRTGSSRPARRRARPTRSSSAPTTSSSRRAKGRVVALHERGLESAYLYGAGDDIGPEQLAGGLGAFFLLTEPPERFGLPAQADSPIQENGAGREPRGRRRRVRGGGGVDRDAWPSRIAGAAGEPPPAQARRPRRRSCASSGGRIDGRDVTPALGTRGEPGPYRRAVEGAKVALAKPRWGDARWSYLFGPDTRYRSTGADDDGEVAAAARAARRARRPRHPRPGADDAARRLDLGGAAVLLARRDRRRLVVRSALACDVAGDHRSAAVARKVALGAVMPGAPLLILDLGRPERFFNMLRIFKPRSPMSMGAWCLMGFSTVAGAAVAADLTGRERPARALGGAAGAARHLPRLLHRRPARRHGGAGLGPQPPLPRRRSSSARRPPPAPRPTGSCSSPPACRSAIRRATRSARSRRSRWPASWRCRRSTSGGSAGSRSRSSRGGPGTLFQAAKWMVRAGLALRLGRARGGPWVHHVASVALPAGRPLLPLRLGRGGPHLGAGRRGRRQDGAPARPEGRVVLSPLCRSDLS